MDLSNFSPALVLVNVVALALAALAAEALRAMEQRSITALFVVDADGAPVGILHIHDCLRAGMV